MKSLQKCNKSTGVYWLKKPVDNISITVSIKSKEEIITLPTFEEYQDRSYKENLQLLDKNKNDTYEFKWQEKIFSKHEYEKYSDSYNCNTDIEFKFHDMIKDTDAKPNKIFSYIDEDCHLPLPIVEKKNKQKSVVPNLNCLNLHEKLDTRNVSISMRELFKQEENNIDDCWTAMHIVYDNSEYNEDSQVLFKQECTLLSLYHNQSQNYIFVRPDINDLDTRPYRIENGTTILGFEYSIDINFNEEGCGEELSDLLNNLFKKWEKKNKTLLHFVMPPLGKKKVFVTLEIISAFGFENDNLYIDYQIKVPEEIIFTGDLKGRTHTSKSSNSYNKKQWRYGHTVDLELEYATGVDTIPPKIYLEAISIDRWRRHRTEGYSCVPLTLEPGKHAQGTVTMRPEELDTVAAETRRYFIGGCHLIKDLDVLVHPQLHVADFRYVSSGTILLSWHVLSQAHSPGSHPEPHSDVIKGAEAVLRQYKKAKATLAEATRDMVKLDGSGDG